jgi:hypothetical protein
MHETLKARQRIVFETKYRMKIFYAKESGRAYPRIKWQRRKGKAINTYHIILEN